MAKYRIVIPVVAQSMDFGSLLLQIPDFRKLTIVNNFDNPEVGGLVGMAEKLEAKVVRWPENRGCAASWNVGLKEIKTHNLDFVIILSPSCEWNKDVEEFADEIEKLEKERPGYMYIARGQHITDTHAFAITKLGLETIGLFDENFHPVYFEDADYYRRMDVLGVDKTFIEGLRKSSDLGGGVKKEERIWRQYLRSAERIKAYYIEKWGGMPAQEKWDNPYDDPKLTARDWRPVDRSKLVPPLTEEQYRRLEDAGTD